jgi:hypothetical protein
MKKLISLLLILCLPAACSFAGAEGAPLGKPYINPNLLTSFTERPGPEENYYLYANFDRFVDVTTSGDSFLSSQAQHAVHILVSSLHEIARNTEWNDPESEVIRILYGMAADTDKLKQDGLAPLMSRVDRLRAVSSTEELTALLQENGFLVSTPVFVEPSFQEAPNNPELQILYVSRSPVLSRAMPENPTEEEIRRGGNTDFDTARAMLMNMQYSREEADRVLQEINRYDNETGTEFPDWLPDPESGLCGPLLPGRDLADRGQPV